MCPSSRTGEAVRAPLRMITRVNRLCALDQIERVCPGEGVDSGIDPELPVDASGVGLDRVDGEEQLASDRALRQAGREQPEHGELGWTEALRARRVLLTGLPHEAPGGAESPRQPARIGERLDLVLGLRERALRGLKAPAPYTCFAEDDEPEQDERDGRSSWRKVRAHVRSREPAAPSLWTPRSCRRLQRGGRGRRGNGQRHAAGPRNAELSAPRTRTWRRRSASQRDSSRTRARRARTLRARPVPP